MKNIYMDFELNDLSISIEQTLLPFSEQEFSEIDLLNFLNKQEQKRYLLNLLSKYETICLGDLTLLSIGAHKWKLEDRRYSVWKYRIKVLNNLPWSVGTKVNADSDASFFIYCVTGRSLFDRKFFTYPDFAKITLKMRDFHNF